MPAADVKPESDSADNRKSSEIPAPSEPVYGLSDLKQHTSEKSCWLLVHGKVYDVTPFLEEHPGGFDIILTSAGKDSTQDFDEIGHSKQARALLEKYKIGQFEGGDSAPEESKKQAASAEAGSSSGTSQTSGLMRAVHVLLPVILLLLAIALNVYSKSDAKKK